MDTWLSRAIEQEAPTSKSMIKWWEHVTDLVSQVREVRSEMIICPSARRNVDVPKLLREIIEKEVYKEDYIEITTYFQNHPVSYENTIEAVRIIAESGMFE